MALPELPVTSFALLGLLSFGDEELTGYELKQRADITMRFYWVAPAMSQVYSELKRLHEHRLVRVTGSGRATRYRLSARGRRVLHEWSATPAGFPVWKHPVALRLMIGHASDQETLRGMLTAYLEELVTSRADLQEVRTMLSAADAPGETYHFPGLVADWGLAHFDSEREITEKTLRRLQEDDA